MKQELPMDETKDTTVRDAGHPKIRGVAVPERRTKKSKPWWWHDLSLLLTGRLWTASIGAQRLPGGNCWGCSPYGEEWQCDKGYYSTVQYASVYLSLAMPKPNSPSA